MKNDEQNLICKCDAIIPNANIEKQNQCNEEGEESGEVWATCDKCGAFYESWTWGEWDNFEHAKSHLQNYIKGSEL